MRLALWALILAALAVSFTMGSTAFNYATIARSVSVEVVDDSLALLGIGAYSSSPHRCFVDVGTSSPNKGRMSILFDTPSSGCGSGAGQGVNAGDGVTSGKYSRYAFHDIIQLTNRGETTILIWANTSTTSGSESLIEVSLEPTFGQMSDAKYGTAEEMAGIAAGTSAYMGVRVKSGMLSSGTVAGTISLEARE